MKTNLFDKYLPEEPVAPALPVIPEPVLINESALGPDVVDEPVPGAATVDKPVDLLEKSIAGNCKRPEEVKYEKDKLKWNLSAFITFASITVLFFLLLSKSCGFFGWSLFVIGSLIVIVVIVTMKPVPEEHDQYVQDQIDQINCGVLPSVPNSQVVPQKGESVHFTAPAVRFITKKRVVGHTASTSGVSIRIAKGITYRTGGVKGEAIYDDVTDSYSGQVAITNKRFIFIAEKKSYTCTLGKISSIIGVDGGKIIFTTSDGEYIFRISTTKVDSISKLFDLILNNK